MKSYVFYFERQCINELFYMHNSTVNKDRSYLRKLYWLDDI